MYCAAAACACLVAADGDDEGFCLEGLAVWVELCTDDCRRNGERRRGRRGEGRTALDCEGGEAEIAVEGEITRARVTVGGREEEDDHGGTGGRRRRSMARSYIQTDLLAPILRLLTSPPADVSTPSLLPLCPQSWHTQPCRPPFTSPSS